MNVTSLTGLGVSQMTVNNELQYQMTMNAAKKMFLEGIISEEDYHEFNTKMIEKYHPIFGVLFYDIELIKAS